MSVCDIYEHVSKWKQRKNVVHSAGHHIAGNNEESEVTQKMSGGVIESLWAILLWEAIKT